MSTAPRAASGRSFNMPVATARTTTTAATAVRLATWVLPPADATTAVRGGLASTAKEPARPASKLPAPTAARSTLKSSGVVSSVRRPGDAVSSDGGRRLHHAQEGHRHGGPHQLPQLVQAGVGERQVGHGGMDRPNDLHAMGHQPGGADQRRGPDDPDRAPGMRWSITSQTTMMASTPTAMANDQPLKWLSWSKNGPHPADGRRAPAGQAENGWQLLDEYLDPDAGQQPGHDRHGEEVGDPAQPEQAGDHQEATHQ